MAFENLQSLNPAANISLQDARALRARLDRAGFPVKRLWVAETHVGLRIANEFEESDLAGIGVPETLAIYVHFDFAVGTNPDQHEAARVARQFKDGTLGDWGYLYADLNPGSRHAWAYALLGVPRVADAVNRALKE